MDNKYDNYDMFDKLIANNKKAQSWTIFWVTTLCLLAGAVLWMAFTISEKNKTISAQKLTLQTQEEFLESKNQLIDSLVANCTAAKTAIVNKCDSVITQTQAAIKEVINANPSNSGNTNKLSVQQNIKLKEADESIQYIKTNLYNVRTNFNKSSTRLFIQYNDKDNAAQVAQLLALLKNKGSYYIPPAEYIDNSFPMIIKFYNYKNDDEEKYLTQLVARQFKVNTDDIRVSYETNPRLKATVEIWIGTRIAETRQQLMIKKQK